MKWLAALVACLAAAAPLCAQDAPAIPYWLTPYPGANPETRQNRILAESSYTAAARPRDVLDHYRGLFATAGLPFRPSAMGYGFLIRAEADACDLTIRVRNQNETTAVQVTCTAPTGRDSTVRKQAEDAGRESIQTMENYDRPVYPAPKAPGPAPAWPAWLARVEGGRPAFQSVGAGAAGYLKSVYLSRLDLAAIRSFYTDLLRANGCEVSAPGAGTLEGTACTGAKGRRGLAVRVVLTTAGRVTRVELRVDGAQ